MEIFQSILILLLLLILWSNSINIKSIMATIAQLTEKVDALQAALNEEQAQIAAAIEALEQTIAELRELVLEGGTAQERDALAAKLDVISEDLKNTIPDTVDETSTTTETPIEE